jgi:hypothetical protein
MPSVCHGTLPAYNEASRAAVASLFKGRDTSPDELSAVEAIFKQSIRHDHGNLLDFRVPKLVVSQGLHASSSARHAFKKLSSSHTLRRFPLKLPIPGMPEIIGLVTPSTTSVEAPRHHSRRENRPCRHRHHSCQSSRYPNSQRTAQALKQGIAAVSIFPRLRGVEVLVLMLTINKIW